MRKYSVKSTAENKITRWNSRHYQTILPAFIQQSLTIENSKRIIPQTWDEPIKFELLNRSFHYTVSIKKNEEIAELILLHSRDELLVTCYKILQ